MGLFLNFILFIVEETTKMEFLVGRMMVRSRGGGMEMVSEKRTAGELSCMARE